MHYRTHIANVPSIVRYGILSRNAIRARGLDVRDISEHGVQERRAKKRVPGIDRPLHDYVNLYFDAHNPMLSKRRSENDNICILRVENDILNEADVIITDKNAARDCWFKPVEEGLRLLNKEEIYATFWLDGDILEQDRKKGIKCAEILVPASVPPGYILGAYVANRTAYESLISVFKRPIAIKTNLFFGEETP